MATFHVYMNGLICHVGEDSDTSGQFKKHAAIINEPKIHDAPRICIDGNDLEGGGNTVSYSIKQNDEITFSLSGSVASTDALFQKTIPSLNFITDGGQLNNNVKNRNKHANVLAYIVYPKGNLTIFRMYEKTGRYILPPQGALDTPHCIGEVVDFYATTNDPVEVKITNPKDPANPTKYKVKANGKICIINDGHISDEKHHLDHHRKLTGAPQIARVAETNVNCMAMQPEFPGCFCPHPPGHGEPDAGDPECSNSQWP